MTETFLKTIPMHKEDSKPTSVKSKLGLIKALDAHEFLLSLREFSTLPSDELKTLANASRFISLDAGEYISTEGDEESINGYIVVSGLLAMLKTSPNGKQLIVELLQNGDIFGMLLMLAGEKKVVQLSARALHRTKLLLIPMTHFQHLLHANPKLFREFAAHLLLCLQSSYSLSRGLAHDRVEVRIASILSSLALKSFHPQMYPASHTLYFTRQQLADLCGTTPETAIRVTRQMQRDGLIDISRPGVINILRLNDIQELAESL